MTTISDELAELIAERPYRGVAVGGPWDGRYFRLDKPYVVAAIAEAIESGAAPPEGRAMTYQCDCCCGAEVPRDQIAVVIAYGIKTGACCACHGVEPDDEPDDMRVIGRLDPPTFDPADYPGFSAAQVTAGLTVLVALLTEAEIEVAARFCPVFRGPNIMGSTG